MRGCHGIDGLAKCLGTSDLLARRFRDEGLTDSRQLVSPASLSSIGPFAGSNVLASPIVTADGRLALRHRRRDKEF